MLTCQRKGISAITNSISARQRWTQSHFIRTSIISYVFEDLGMTKKEDLSQDLKPSRIRQNSHDLCLIVNMIKETMNPFDDDITKDHLFNKASGKAASISTQSFLLNVTAIGSTSRNKLIKECVEDPARFEKTVPKHTFAAEGKKFKVNRADNKMVAATMMRDLFGSILYHSLQKRLIWQLPLSVGHVDGITQKTPKVKLLNELESRVTTIDPSQVDVNIIE